MKFWGWICYVGWKGGITPYFHWRSSTIWLSQFGSIDERFNDGWNMNLGLGEILDVVLILFELDWTWYWFDWIWFDLILIGYDLIWCDFDIDMIWFDWIWYDWMRIWFDLINNPMILQTSKCEIWIKVQYSWQCSYVQSRRCDAKLN